MRETDWTVRRWEHFRDLLPGLFRLVMGTFKSILEAVDRFLYTVDEWLRFRQGQRRCDLLPMKCAGNDCRGSSSPRRPSQSRRLSTGRSSSGLPVAAAATACRSSAVEATRPGSVRAP